MQPSLAQEARQAILLMAEYAFELRGQAPTAQVVQWLEAYRPSWIRDAVVEALYQGRYKAISVQQILALWQRRGQPVRHANIEFERTIAQPLGLQLTASLSIPAASYSSSRLPTQDHASSAVGAARLTESDVTPASSSSAVSASAAAEAPDQRSDPGSVEVKLDQLPEWNNLSPPFTPTQTTPSPRVAAAGSTPFQRAVTLSRDQHAAATSTASGSADQGVLTSAHQPIQPFRPDLPFPSHRSRR